MDESVLNGEAHNTADATATGIVRWLTIHDDLLRGLAHAISNRLATVTASASMLEAGMAPDGRVIACMQDDAGRLEGLLQSLRQLPRRGHADLEPMLLSDALDGARRLAEEHPDLRGRTIRVESVGDVMPVRAEPTSVLHATAVALLAAARRGSTDVVVTLETDGDLVRLVARGNGGAEETEEDLLRHDVDAIDWLLITSRGHAVVTPGGCGFTLPTLQASRRQRS